MAEPDLARLIVRHRHVAPMLSALLSGTNAGVRISDAEGTVILEREANGIGFERFPIAVEGRTIGWVEGDRVGRAIASVLSYAVARETDKRSLAREALDRYRELNLVYDLAERLSGELDVGAVATIASGEAGKLPAGGSGFLLVAGEAGALAGVTGADGGAPPTALEAGRVGEGILGTVAASATAEEVNDVDTDPRSTPAERAFASLICAPIVARGRTIGVLGAGSVERIEYQAADLKLLAAIAAIVGPALDQARIHEASGAGVG
jgi:putative methionine-R-sulfoxide reductase with GAF domain